MSLAINAAPIEEDDLIINQNAYNNHYQNNNENIIQKKRIHNKTQKRNLNENFSVKSEKVNSVLKSLHSNNLNEEEENLLGDFKPLEPPKSASIERSKKEPMENYYEPKPIEKENSNLKNYKENFMNDEEVKNYYKNLVPNFNPSKYNDTMKYFNDNFYKNSNFLNSSNNNEQNSIQSLINKLNYIINLLEEQQDQKTNNVTEEIVLYSFLGIFIIFIVDSFSKVGKYVR